MLHCTSIYTIVGDCDSDADCIPGLRCGTDNCPHKLIASFDSTDDCCFKPEETTLKPPKGIKPGIS